MRPRAGVFIACVVLFVLSGSTSGVMAGPDEGCGGNSAASLMVAVADVFLMGGGYSLRVDEDVVRLGLKTDAPAVAVGEWTLRMAEEDGNTELTNRWDGVWSPAGLVVGEEHLEDEVLDPPPGWYRLEPKLDGAASPFWVTLTMETCS